MGFTPQQLEVPLTQFEHDRFRLGKEPAIAYTDWLARTHAVDPDLLNVDGTDLASVPTFLWWLVGSYGRHTRAALVHDYLVRKEQLDRADSDTVFRAALADSDVPIIRRWLMWTAVSLETSFKRLPGRRKTGALLLLAHAAMLVAAFLNWLWADWLWAEEAWSQAALATGAILSWIAVWRSRAFWILLGAVLVGPPGVLVLVFQRLIAVFEYVAVPVARALLPIAWLRRALRQRRGRPQPPPPVVDMPVRPVDPTRAGPY